MCSCLCVPAYYAVVSSRRVESSGISGGRRGSHSRRCDMPCLRCCTGPGTSVFAAQAVWPSINDVVLVDHSMSMTQAAEHLLYDTPGALFLRHLGQVAKQHARKFDLVVVSHTLSELCSDHERLDTVDTLWSLVADGGCLVITERGSRYATASLPFNAVPAVSTVRPLPPSACGAGGASAS